MTEPKTTTSYGVAGAKLTEGGKIETGYGLGGRKPDSGFHVCPDCDGEGIADASSLVIKPCNRCGGIGQILPTFPIPKSGRVQITATGLGKFEVECIGINGLDNDMLQGFFCGMQGRAHTFRFEHGSDVYQECAFESDSAEFGANPDRNYVSFPIEIIRK